MTSKAESVHNSVYRLEYLRGQMALLKDSFVSGKISVTVYRDKALPLQKKIHQAEAELGPPIPKAEVHS